MRISRIKQSETIEIMRSQINFAPYNPRLPDEDVVNDIKNNFKAVGFLGGIFWNKRSGNLVSGHKRIESMDLIFHFPQNDYPVKVEMVDFDEKTEMEQNLFMNNQNVQGRFDYAKIGQMLPKIDLKMVKLSEIDLDKVQVFTKTDLPELNLQKTQEPVQQKKPATQEEIEKIKQIKRDYVEDAYNRHDDLANSHVTIVFENWDAKVAFMELLNLDIDAKFIKGEEFAEKLNLF